MRAACPTTASRPLRDAVPPLRLLAAAGLAAVLAGCSSGGSPAEPGTGRLITGTQCFIGSFTFEPADAGSMRRERPLCEPTGVDATDTCPDNLDDLDTDSTGVDFCADGYILGEVSDPSGDPEKVRLDILAQSGSGGPSFFFTVQEIDLTQIGENDGVLSTPIEYGPCDIVAGADLDTSCEYSCEWQETSSSPCGGLASGATTVPVSCFEDEQPDPCDAASLQYGSSDRFTLTEITVVQNGDHLGLLEQTVVGGEFSVTLVAAYPDDTHALTTVSGKFRTRVAASPFVVVSGEDTTCDPTECVP